MIDVNAKFDNIEFISFDTYLSQYNINDKKEFIKPTGKYLDNFRSYSNIVDAVQMIKYHYLKNNTVYILSDSGDTDGVTSSCILYDYLKRLKHDWKIVILIHENKERGLQDDKLFNKMKSMSDCLLIIPDAGSNDNKRVKVLFDNGIDCIVCDHHKLETPIEQGILISNQKGDKGVSPYGSGCLVTHKLLQALDVEFDKTFSKDYIDMVALSLISDVMNMSDMQNRTYYHFGLEKRSRVKNKFILQLIDDYIGDKEYTQRDIAFKIVPKLNAVSRSGNQKLKRLVYKAFLNITDIKEISSLCADEHAEQVKIVNDIVEQNKDDIDYKNNLIVVANDTIQKNYAGLVASKLSHGHPIIVGSIHKDTLIGSFRSPIDIDDTLVNNPLIDWKRGHAMASGIQLPSKNISLLVDYYNTIEMPKPKIDVLYSCTISDIPHEIFNDFTKYPTLYGQGFPNPFVHIHDIKFKSNEIATLGDNGRTLKLQKKGITFMWFMATNETKERLLNNKEECILEVIGTMNVNVYYGKVTHQIIVDSFDLHTNTFDDLM